jgi:DNA-binding phage protein
MKKAKSWEEEVAERLRKSPRSVAAYMTGLCEADDELSVIEALKLTVDAVGVKQFAKMAKVTPVSVSKLLKKKSMLESNYINKFLKAFGLRAELVFKNS